MTLGVPEPCPRCGAVYAKGPRCRCNPALDNYTHRGVGWVGVVVLILAFLAWGLAAMLSIWARTCGMGAAP